MSEKHPDQIFAYTGELPSFGYVEFCQAFEGEDGYVMLTIRNTEGKTNMIALPPEKRQELAHALAGTAI